MLDDTPGSEESTAPPGREAVLGALGDRDYGQLATAGTPEDEHARGVLASSRRGVLAVGGLVGTGLLSGCVRFISGGPVKAGAKPVILPPDQVSDVGEPSARGPWFGGFRRRARARKATGLHSVEVANRTVDLEAESWALTYQRKLECTERLREDVGCDSDVVMGETVILTSPSARVLGSQVNPIDDFSPEDVVDRLGVEEGVSAGPDERFASGEFEDPADVLRFSYAGSVSEVRNVRPRSDGWETVEGSRGSFEASRFSLDLQLRTGQELPAQLVVTKASHRNDIVLVTTWTIGTGSTPLDTADGFDGKAVVVDTDDFDPPPPVASCKNCGCYTCHGRTWTGHWIHGTCGCVDTDGCMYSPTESCDCDGTSETCDFCACGALIAVGAPDDVGIAARQYVDDNVFGPVERHNEKVRDAARG